MRWTAEMDPAIRYKHRRNTASIMMVWLFFIWKKWKLSLLLDEWMLSQSQAEITWKMFSLPPKINHKMKFYAQA